VVIESPVDSGALLTATEAAQQGREVFAVPGPIGTGRSAGCHRLIKEGAKLVEDAQDIFDELGLLPLAAADDGEPGISGFQPAPLDLSPDQRQVLDLLTLEAQTVDALIVQSRMHASRITGALTLLELRGLARRVPGNAYVRAL
jgi:DNA processing protein